MPALGVDSEYIRSGASLWWGLLEQWLATPVELKNRADNCGLSRNEKAELPQVKSHRKVST